MNSSLSDVGVVIIGRNEGERFERCLASLAGKAAAMVYVDSNSTDGSPEKARVAGAQVVSLDTSIPFSMGRARNEGVEALLKLGSFKHIQFVDGDCGVDAGWMARAQDFLNSNPGYAAVCGRRKERFPEHSIYNRICDFEWNTPIGDADSCGGDVLFGMEDFRSVGGFDAQLIAGEEPELCFRIRKHGKKIRRIDFPMTYHDANILHFGQWWKRLIRGGYGAVASWQRCGGNRRAPFASQIRSAYLWGAVWPFLCAFTFVVAVISSKPYAWPMLGVFLLAGVIQTLRIARQSMRRGLDGKTSLLRALLLFQGKMAQWIGIMRYTKDRLQGQQGKIIEYKTAGTP
jgi:glycosyltransferase involved in cell wall biosynthesis